MVALAPLDPGKSCWESAMKRIATESELSCFLCSVCRLSVNDTWKHAGKNCRPSSKTVLKLVHSGESSSVINALESF